MKKNSYLAFFVTLFSFPCEIYTAQNSQVQKSAFAQSFDKTRIGKNPCAFLYTQHLAGNIALNTETTANQLDSSLAEYRQDYSQWVWNPKESKLEHDDWTETITFFKLKSGPNSIHSYFGTAEDCMSNITPMLFHSFLTKPLPYAKIEELFYELSPEDRKYTLDNSVLSISTINSQNKKNSITPLLAAFLRFKTEKSLDSIQLCRFFTNNSAIHFDKPYNTPLNAHHIHETGYLTPQEFDELYQPAYKKQLVQVQWLFWCLTHPYQDDPSGPAFERGVDTDSALLIIQHCFDLANTPEAASLFKNFINIIGL